MHNPYILSLFFLCLFPLQMFASAATNTVTPANNRPAFRWGESAQERQERERREREHLEQEERRAAYTLSLAVELRALVAAMFENCVQSDAECQQSLLALLNTQKSGPNGVIDNQYPNFWLRRLWVSADEFDTGLRRAHLLPVIQDFVRAIWPDVTEALTAVSEGRNNWSLSNGEIDVTFYGYVTTGVSVRLSQFVKVQALPEIPRAMAYLLNVVDISGMSAPMRTFVQRVLHDYYDGASPDLKGSLIAGYVGAHPDANDRARMIAVLPRGGPTLQKLVQLVADRATSAESKALLDEFKSGLRPMSQEELKETVTRVFSGGLHEHFSAFDRKALAAGSVAQVHRATVKGQAEGGAVVKLIKPRARLWLPVERATMQRAFADNRPVYKIAMDVCDSIEDEFKLPREKAFIRRGAVYNKYGIGTVKLVPGFDEYEDVVVMEFVAGQQMHVNLDDDREQCAKGVELAKVAEALFDVGLFGDGMIHSDLHSGNIMHPLTLIDFGSGEILKTKHQQAAVTLIVGVELRDRTYILDAFKLIGKMTKKQFKDLSTYVDTRINDLKLLDKFHKVATGTIVNGLMATAIDSYEIELEREFVQFNRTRMLIEQQIEHHSTTYGARCRNYPQPKAIADIYAEVLAKGIRAHWERFDLGMVFTLWKSGTKPTYNSKIKPKAKNL